MKKLATVLLLALGIVFSASLVSAADPGYAQVTASVDLGEIYTASGQTVTTEAGNISFTNLTSNLSTYRWAGIIGTADGVVNLGDSNGNIFYNWTGLGRLVYASEAPAITWASLADFTQANLDAYPALSYINGPGDSDNYSNTFTGVPENIGSGIFSSITSDYAFTYDDVGTQDWRTYSLWDTTNVVWAALVQQGGATAYNGQTVDYQMIVPENGTDGDLTVTQYNLWIELQ